MPHGPGEGAPLPVRQRGRPKPKVKIRTIKHAPAKPSTVIHRAVGKHVSPQIKQNIKQAAPPKPRPSSSYLVRRKGELRRQIATNEKAQARLTALAKPHPLPKVGAFRGSPAPKIPHPKLLKLQGEHADLTNKLGRIETLVASRQERHPENIPIIGSPNVSTADALLLAASLAPVGEAVGAGLKAAKAGAEGSKAAEVIGKAAQAAKTSRVGRAAGKVAAKTPKLQTAEESAAKAGARTRGENVTARSVASRVRGVARRTARATARVPSKAVRKAVSTPLGPETRTAAVVGPAAAKAAGLPLGAIKADFVAHAVANEAAAAIKHPLKTAGTTVRVAEQIPSAVLSPAQAVYESAKTGSLKPLEGFGKSLIDYGKLYGELGGPQGEYVASHQLGLIPAITAGLAGKEAVKGVKALRGSEKIEAPKITRAQRKLEKIIASPHQPPDVKDQAVKDLETLNTETAKGRHTSRKREAQQTNTQGEIAHSLIQHDLRRGKRSLKRLGRRPHGFDTLLGRANRVQVGDVTLANVAAYLGQEHLLGPDHGFTLAELIRRADKIDPHGHAVSEFAADPRKIIAAVTQHPEILNHPLLRQLIDHATEMHNKNSIARHTEEAGTRQATPSLADEVVRLGPVARAEGIARPHEMPPHEIRKTSEVTGGIGVDVTKAVREESSKLRAAAKKLRREAQYGRAPERPGGRKMRSLTRTEARAKYTEAANLEARAAFNEGVVRRPQQAANLEKQAFAVEAGKFKSPERIPPAEHATDLRNQAEALRIRHEGSQGKLHDEFIGKMNDVFARKPYSNGFYIAQHDLALSRLREESTALYPTQKQLKKEKFRTDELMRTGRVDLSAQNWLDSIVSQRVGRAERMIGRVRLHDQAVSADGRRVFAAPEIMPLRREGKLPMTGTRVAVSDLGPLVQRDPAFRMEVEQARLRARALHSPGDRKLYVYFKSGETWKEYVAQRKQASDQLQFVRNVNRLASGLIIGTSPVWFALQLAASPTWLAFSHTNPAEWVRAGRMAKAIYDEAPADVKPTLEGLMGANMGDMLSTEAGGRGWEPQSASRAMRIAQRSPAGRAVFSVIENLRGGGPLIKGNRNYEAGLRYLAGLMEMDKVLKGHQREIVKDFQNNTARLVDTTRTQMDNYAKLSKAQRATYFVDHPELWQEMEKGLENALGSWGYMSSKERGFASVLIFYPFLRASMRWFAYAAPKNSPWKSAIITNLAQSNINAVVNATGGQPSYFTGYGQVPFWDAQGNVTAGPNLYRISPGGNTVLEQVGSGKIDLQTITSPLTPPLAIPIQTLANQTPFGTPSTVSRGQQAAIDALSLSPFTRPLQYKVKPRSVTSQMFANMTGRPGTLANNLLDPHLMSPSIEAQRDANRAGAILAWINQAKVPKSFSEVKALPISQQAEGHRLWQKRLKLYGELDKLEVKYGALTKAQAAQQAKIRKKRSAHATSTFGYTGFPQPSSGYGSSNYGSSSYGSSSAYK